ncbi:substrate-binding domain-containing protein, partial [Clostridium perfringens]|uniref:hypothetical protein n=1 Tax=Clostridium perfringens TaxID=1502 RepID=UPI002ACBEFC2
DALVAIEPFVSKIVKDGGKILWNSRNSDKNLVMWCFDEEFYNSKPKAVINFHNALDEAAMIFINLNNEEKVQIFTECCGYEREVAESFKEFTFEKSSNYREEDFNLCQEWMYREGEIKRLFDANVLIKDII